MIRLLLIFMLLLTVGDTFGQEFSSQMIPDRIFSYMQGRSWPKTAELKRSDYRYLTVAHYDENGVVRQGELVCHKSVADELLKIFRELYAAHYPIHSVRLIDNYDANDEKSMSDNNTSCFCYRKVNGSKKLSKHSRGIAIDINPLWNPCISTNGKIEPANAKKYKDRTLTTPTTPLITPQDTCYKIFTRHNWHWGGSWKTKKDYQHFER